MTWPDIRDRIEAITPTRDTTTDLAHRFGLSTKQMKNLLDHYGFIPDVDYRRGKPGPKGPRS